VLVAKFAGRDRIFLKSKSMGARRRSLGNICAGTVEELVVNGPQSEILERCPGFCPEGTAGPSSFLEEIET
jgi:hypothetical protein